MVIIAGLGNPGREYQHTRHNVGFEVADILADRSGIEIATRDGKSLIGKGQIAGRRVVLMKPMTYMNLSGEAIREQVTFYKADPSAQLIVVNDDIDLPEGQLRIRTKGSAGGHNGLKNITLNLGTDAFTRIRVGVGAKPSPDYDLADYVLGHPTGSDRKTLDEAESLAADAVEMILKMGADAAMNCFNRKKDDSAGNGAADTERNVHA
ncbi:MAG: aminoacyl-tRNA hydrolase [Lachnospiraceae bacterium]|nr:aminoacyl-tRNA hydrolase [Lachnospiraceae bacterium]